MKTNVLKFLIIFRIFQLISTEMVSEDSCNAEDMAMAQWFSQMSNFVKQNENNAKNVLDIHVKLLELQGNLQDSHKNVLETHKKLEQDLLQLKNENSAKNVLNIQDKLLELQRNLQDTQKSVLEAHKKLDQDLKHLKTDIMTIQENVRGGDVVIQRRLDGSVNFQRTWAEFKAGFGDSSAEFFIGLEKLHKLTNTRPYELVIVMEDWENDRRYARYDQFVVGSETEKYALKSLGKYSGSAGDSLTYHLGQKFTTKDQDNDADSRNCAVIFTGAWWHNACHQSNLNGQYLKGTITQFAVGTHWLAFKGYHYSLKYVEMVLRPN